MILCLRRMGLLTGLLVAVGSGCDSDGDDGSTVPSSGGTAGTDAGGGSGGLPFGGDDASAGAPSGPECGGFGQSTECTECLASNCCDEGDACRASSACTSLVECSRDCGGQDATACVQDCLGDFFDGSEPYNGLLLCMGMNCEMECPFRTP